MTGRAPACLLGALLLSAGWAGSAAAQSLTVEQAVSVALRDNPRLRAARARWQGAQASTEATSRRRLPALRVSEELQQWDRPFAIAFPLTTTAAPGAAPAPELVARERTTSTLVVSADQPVVGLGRLGEEAAAQEENAAASAAGITALQASVRLAVQQGFLRHFEARALEQIAESSARELGDQLVVARARLASGVITQADVLRIEVALANARQQGISAHSEAEIARVNLLALLGRSGADANEQPLALVEPTTLLADAQRSPPTLPSALDRARRHRAELAIDAHRARAAAHLARARTWALAPEVDLEAAYLRVDGQVFTPKNSAYVGLKARWNIWDWGADWKQRRAAQAEADATHQDGEDRARQIEAELATSLAQAQAARAAISTAQAVIAGAQEAYRETDAQVKAGAATTTDLLESQSALGQARLNLTRAQYALASTSVQLRHALGE